MDHLHNATRDFSEREISITIHWNDNRHDNPEEWDEWLRNEADKNYHILVSKYNTIQSTLDEESEEADEVEKKFRKFFKKNSLFYPLNIKYNIEAVGIEGHLFKIAS